MLLGMFDPQMSLLSSVLAETARALEANPQDAAAWAAAHAALTSTGAQEPEIAAILEARDAVALRALLEAWRSGARHLPVEDREVLKRAMKAYRKSLKVTLLDAESSLGGGPFSGGRRSAIAGITPPSRYPREVWKELARQGRLIDAGQGVYELPPE
jgi:hypothetical protein